MARSHPTVPTFICIIFLCSCITVRFGWYLAALVVCRYTFLILQRFSLDNSFNGMTAVGPVRRQPALA